jgi:hypothetical protein
MVRTGIVGFVNDISTVRGWEVVYGADVQRFYASNTRGGPGRLGGNQDWTGTIRCYGYSPEVMPGEVFDFKGSNIDGVIAGEAVVQTMEMVIDIEAGAPIEHTLTFGGNGELDLDASAGSVDATEPEAWTSIGCEVSVFGGYFVYDDVRKVTLNISNEVQAYASSDTEGWMKRLPGNLDATVAIDLYESDFNEIWEPNIVADMQILVDAANDYYWDLGYMISKEATNINVDREAAALVSYTANWEFTGHYDEVFDGWIDMPGQIEYWSALNGFGT